MEDGDVNDARDEAKEAEDLFRAAELEAIKIAYLVETRNKINSPFLKNFSTPEKMVSLVLIDQNNRSCHSLHQIESFDRLSEYKKLLVSQWLLV